MLALIVETRAGRCALPLGPVLETLRPRPTEEVPGTPPSLVGLSVVRGAPVPVVDLGILLGAGPGGGSGRWVRLQVEQRVVVLAVSGVIGVRALDPERFQALPPLLARAGDERVEGLAAADGAFVRVLRMARLIPEAIWNGIPGGGGP